MAFIESFQICSSRMFQRNGFFFTSLFVIISLGFRFGSVAESVISV